MMTDREKVIKGLECCMSEKICNGPCPYKGQCDDGGYYYSKAIEDAIELLKAQEPVSPVFERQFMSSIELYNCGRCGTSVGAKGIAKYCMKCGQAVKW